MDTRKSLEKHVAKMQYHSIMARKHRKLARFQYTILIKILGHEDTVKKYLKEIGIKNTLFNKGGIKMKEKPKIKFGCYFCGKGVDTEQLAVDEEGNVIMAKESSGLTDYDNHFICKKCYEKVNIFFETK